MAGVIAFAFRVLVAGTFVCRSVSGFAFRLFMVIAMAMVLVITVVRLARSAALGRVVIVIVVVVVGMLLGHGLRTCPVNTRWFERRMTSQPE